MTADLIARENDIVTCVAKNHPMFRITRDVVRGEIMRDSLFEVQNPALPEPRKNEKTVPCPQCGSNFRGLGGRVHFEDGYH